MRVHPSHVFICIACSGFSPQLERIGTRFWSAAGGRVLAAFAAPGSGPSTPSCSSMNPLKEAQAALPTERVEVRPGRVLAVHHRAGRFIHGRPSDVAIFVHGSCASLVHWRAQIDHLQAAGLAIVAYDFLGCGRSAKPHEQHGQNAFALARSSPCGHPSLQMSARFSRAALRAERRALAAWMPKIGCGCLLPRRRFHSL